MPNIDTLMLDIESSSSAAAVASLNNLTSALARMQGQLNQTTIGRYGAALKSVSTGTTAGATAAKSSSRSIMSSVARMGSFIFVARLASRAFSGMIKQSTDYAERLNLFSAAMGQYGAEALSYAEKVQNAMGIDMSDWIKAQGVFQELLLGFGVGSEKAALMSKNMTQLSYDVASFYNMDVTAANNKIQSGLAGQIRAVRTLGFDLSMAKLQEIAYANGLTQKVSAMSQAEKSQLRYIALMTQITNIQGDMARTLESPANQLRIFDAQLQMASRAIGNIFIPALNAILPAGIAVLQIIQQIANAIASLFGFELFAVDYSGIDNATSATDDLDSALTSAGGSAKKLKGMLAGFDELTVIGQTSGGGGGGSGGALGDLLGGLELPTYEFLGKIETKIKDIVASIRTFWDDFKPSILGVLSAIAAFGIAKTILSAMEALGWIKNGGTIALGVAAVAGGFVVISESLEKIFLDSGNANLNILQVLGGFVAMEAVLTSVGFLLGGAPGAVVGGILGVIVAIVAGMKAWNDAKLEKSKQEVASYYGELEVASDKLKELAELRLSNTFTVTVGLAVAQWDKVAALDEQIAAAQQDADLKLVYLQLGIDTSPEAVSAYTEQVKGIVEQVKSRLDASQAGTALTMKAFFGEVDASKYSENATAVNAEFKKNIDLLAQKYYDYLGVAFADQKFAVDEQKIALEMYTALQNALELAQGMQHRQDVLVNITNFKLSDLTLKSYNVLRDALVATSNEKIEEAKRSVAAAQVELEVNVEKAQYNYNNASPENKAAMAQLLVDAQAALDGHDFGLALDAKVNEINLSLSQDFYSAFKETWGPKLKNELQAEARQFMLGENGVLEFGVEYQFAYTQTGDKKKATFAALQGMVTEFDDAAAKMLKDRGGKESEWYKTLVQSLSDSAAAAAKDGSTIMEYRKLGKALPAGMLDAFNDYQLGLALTGDLTAQSYLAAKDAAASPEFLQTLAAVKGMGASLPPQYRDGVVANIDPMIAGINAGLVSVNQTLFDNFVAMGIDLRDYAVKIPAGIDTALADAFKNQKRAYNLDAGITINTTVTEKIKYATSLTSAGVKSIFESTVSPAELPIAAFKKVAGLAGGGVVDSGDYFYANENGVPEYVGSFGGHTAVANNDQIVEGIAAGVASANERQNVLLREQNALLRALVDKENTVEPSAAWGAFNAKSDKLYAKASG